MNIDSPHKSGSPAALPVRLTRSVVQATQMLGLYQAELARILGVQCSDIGELFSGKHNLDPDTVVWEKTQLFTQFYDVLSNKLKGDDVAMFNWLRRKNSDLEGVPLLLMVDEGKLEQVLEYITGEMGLEASKIKNFDYT